LARRARSIVERRHRKLPDMTAVDGLHVRKALDLSETSGEHSQGERERQRRTLSVPRRPPKVALSSLALEDAARSVAEPAQLRRRQEKQRRTWRWTRGERGPCRLEPFAYCDRKVSKKHLRADLLNIPWQDEVHRQQSGTEQDNRDREGVEGLKKDRRSTLPTVLHRIFPGGRRLKTGG
jgi:hypothetical protein